MFLSFLKAAIGPTTTTPLSHGETVAKNIYNGDPYKVALTLLIGIGFFLILGGVFRDKMLSRVIGAVSAGAVVWVGLSWYHSKGTISRSSFFRRSTNFNGAIDITNRQPIWLLVLLIPIGLLAYSWSKNRFVSILLLIGGVLLSTWIIVMFGPKPVA